MLTQVNHFLNASKYVNYNRLTNSNYSKLKSSALIARGALEAMSCYSFKKARECPVECNICGWRGKKFLNFYTGYDHIYKNAVCPGCYSHPRHRSYSITLREICSRLSGRVKALHFAPEHHIANVVRAFESVDYLSVDIDHTKAMRREDIQSLSFKDNSFDLIICIHVFEHIENDRKAMREVFRVLKPGGIALLDVPLDTTREVTYEDDTIVTPEERAREFWQWDHLRLYGRDYANKLSEAGFTVNEKNIIEAKGSAYIARFGLENTPNFVCTK